jgi:hypothetical protein
MKKTLFAEYTAPEMEIISTVVEAGFEGSGFTATIESSDELEGGNY